ncbi:MAG: hypothetical protein DMF59_12615 [Acidobacteria bacterium]|nr:MAG: hypothetical protein DMF59_12615 [Acidobacteriota bacterium]
MPRPRVLVAESDVIVLALISHILNRQGYIVDTAGTAAEADAHLKARSYDAILLDAKVACADVDGRRLIILSSDDAPTHISCRAVLRKPIEFGLLVESVASCVTSTD